MSAISQYPDAVIAEILQLPAGQPPNGEPYSFKASENNGPAAFAFLLVAAVVSTISLIVRSYTKLKLMKQWNVEDTLLLLSLTMLVFYFTEGILAGQHGSSRHMWTITLGEYYAGVEHVNLSGAAFCIFQALVKVAILLQFHRIFVPNHSNIRRSPLHYIIYATIGITVVFYTIMTFCSIWICNPREAFWNPYVKGTCMDWVALSEAVAMFTVLSDFALLLIPVFPVLRLQMAKEKKIAIIGVFAIGFIDCTAAIIRAYYTWRLVEETDYSWNSSIQGMCTAVEMSFGILVATLPVVPRFYKHFKQRGFALTTRRMTAQQASYGNQLGPRSGNSPSAQYQKHSERISTVELPVLKSSSSTSR